VKILIFAPNWIGDVIFITPIFKALKKNYRNLHLGCIIPKRCRQVPENNPFIDEIIEFDERITHRTLLKKIFFAKSLYSKKYDKVILLHRSLTRALICYFAGIQSRIGVASKKRSFLITNKISNINKDLLHKQDYYLRIAQGLGIKIDDTSCEIYPSKEKSITLNLSLGGKLTPDDILVGISLFTNWAPKNWPEDNFIQLIETLSVNTKNIKFVITAKDKADSFISKLKNVNPDSIVNLTGKTSLKELIDLYGKLDLVIAGDSGPLHLAAAIGTKYIGLFGPTDPSLTAPRSNTLGKIIFSNKDCSIPCYEKNCEKSFICMKNISAEEVSRIAQNLLSKK